jgi:hypothetical protein
MSWFGYDGWDSFAIMTALLAPIDEVRTLPQVPQNFNEYMPGLYRELSAQEKLHAGSIYAENRIGHYGKH